MRVSTAHASPPMAVAHAVAVVRPEDQTLEPSAPPKEMIYSSGQDAEDEIDDIATSSTVFKIILSCIYFPCMILSSPVILIERVRAGKPICHCCQSQPEVNKR